MFRISKIRSSLYKDRTFFEYLFYKLDFDRHTQTTEDQLRISLNLMLVAQFIPSPLNNIYCNFLFRYLTTLYYDASQASLSSSVLADPALDGEPATRKREHEDIYTDISSNIHYSTSIDKIYNTSDTSNKDPQSVKRRKPRSVPVVTTTASRRYNPLCIGQPSLNMTLSNIYKIDNVQSQDNIQSQRERQHLPFIYLVILLANSNKKREIRNLNYEMANKEESDDFKNKDYNCINNVAASEMRHLSCSQKRVKRAKDRESNDIETPSTQSLDVLY